MIEIKKDTKVNLMSKEDAHKLILELENKAKNILLKQKRVPYSIKFEFALDKDQIVLRPVGSEITNITSHNNKSLSLMNLLFTGVAPKFLPKEYLESEFYKYKFSYKMTPSSNVFTLSGDKIKETLMSELVLRLNTELQTDLLFKVRAKLDNFIDRDIEHLFYGAMYFRVELLPKKIKKFISEPYLMEASSIFFFYSDKNKEKLLTLYKKIKLITEYLNLLFEAEKVNNALQAKILEIETVKI